MRNIIKVDKLKRIMFYTAFFWLVCHGYRFLNNLYTGDTLGSVFQDDILWQRSLGRFMQPLPMIMRGTIVAPWLLFVIAVFFFSLSFYLISELLKVENKYLLFIMCGVLSCNSTITCANAAYTPWIDIYAVSLFLITLGVWLFGLNKWWGYITGVTAFVISMGFYQAYIDVAVVLFMIILLGDILQKKEIKQVLKKSVAVIIGLLSSGMMYYIVYKTINRLHHVTEAVSYNSISDVGNYEGVSIFYLITGAYKQFFAYLFHQGTFVSTILLGKKVSDVWDMLIIISVVCVFICLILILIYIDKKKNITIYGVIFQIIILLLFPLAANCIYVISKGFEYELMIYSFLFLYVLLIFLLERIPESKNINKLALAVVVPFAIIIWNSIVYSNQVYFKVEMQNEAALSYATRLVNDIENLDGYEPGVTPVLIVGFPTASENVRKVFYLSDVNVHGNYKTAFSYPASFPYYINNYLESNMVLIELSESDYPEGVQNMPYYPEKGAIQILDGIVVVNISE